MEAQRSLLELMKPVRLSDIDGGNRFTKDDKEIDAILKISLTKHGQTRPIYITKDNKILEGSRIYRMMIELGYHWIYAVPVDAQEHGKIQHINNLQWYQLDFALLGRRLKTQQEVLREIPISSQDVIDFIDFSDFRPDDYKEVKAAPTLFDEL